MQGRDAAAPATGPRPFWKNPFLWATVAGIITVTAMRPFLRRIPDPPPVRAQLPAWSLIDQNGKPFGSRELEGQVYVASFFSTRCEGACGQVMTAMKALQDRWDAWGVSIKLVSISVDPEADTPEKLRAHAKQAESDLSRWTFVTGDLPGVRQLVVDGFHAPMTATQTATRGVDLDHAARMIIVDQRGGVRGYYETTEPGIDEVFHRAQHVLNSP